MSLTFHANHVSLDLGNNLHEVSDPIFKEKMSSVLSSAEFAHSMVSIRSVVALIQYTYI